MIAQMRPRIFTNAFVTRPQFLTNGFILAGVGHTRGLAVLDDLGQVDRHVAVDVEDLPVYYEASEAAD